jgi:hypothetical protein
VAVDVGGTAADLVGLRDGLRARGSGAEALDLETVQDGSSARVLVFRGPGALGALVAERRLILAGDVGALDELASRVDGVLQNVANPRPIEGYHAHVEVWDGDLDRGPAGELTVFVDGTHAGSSACPRGCQVGREESRRGREGRAEDELRRRARCVSSRALRPESPGGPRAPAGFRDTPRAWICGSSRRRA